MNIIIIVIKLEIAVIICSFSFFNVALLLLELFTISLYCIPCKGRRERGIIFFVMFIGYVQANYATFKRALLCLLWHTSMDYILFILCCDFFRSFLSLPHSLLLFYSFLLSLLFENKKSLSMPTATE